VSVFAHQVRTEQLVFWRSREAAVFIFIFPVLLFVLLASVFGDGDYEGRPVTDWLLTGLLGYGAANTAFAGLAITLVVRREYGILKRLRSTPLSAPVFFAGVLASILIVFALQSLVLIALGRLVFDAALPEQPVGLAVTLAFGAAAMAALGVGVAGLIRSEEGASAVVNVILLPMAFLSGAFGPTRDLPRFLEALADALPLRHFIDAVQGVYLDGDQPWDHAGSLAVVAAWAAVGLVLASRYFGWQPRGR
jgi:ABC-2 type transport system permease protein